MISNFKRANLMKLADFLEKKHKILNFDMKYFISYGPNILGDTLLDIVNSEYKYGTTACAAGHGPMAGISPIKGETWDDYINRCFIETYSTSSDWLFSGRWTYYDNTALGAAARIRYFLDHEEEFEGYSFEFNDQEKYAPYLLSNRKVLENAI